MPDRAQQSAPQQDTDEDHFRPGDGLPCPYVARNGFCSKCGWTVDLMAALQQSVTDAREARGRRG